LKNGERVQTLINLGLTLNQARAYLTLIQFGPANAKKLSENSKITRQDIYRVMPTLEQTGIVEKAISTPTIYKAIPMRQGTRILLDRKIAEQKQLQKKTRELVQDHEDVCQEKENIQETPQFFMIPGIEYIIQKLGETLLKSKRSLDVVTSSQRFSSAILEFKDKYKHALERGVKIRIATEKQPLGKAACEIIQSLIVNKNFEARWFDGAPEAIISIFDEKEASVTITQIANSPRASALWSNDLSFVALAQNYFNNKWNSSVKFNCALSDV
jgi:HTH-type transcriptional regulator, sugar sensing transcriptional regulator